MWPSCWIGEYKSHTNGETPCDGGYLISDIASIWRFLLPPRSSGDVISKAAVYAYRDLMGLTGLDSLTMRGMRYTLRQLEYFVAAGEAGSITLASERVHISQPSVSTAVSHLERELGVKLFLRHHAQGLSLTPAGQDLLREAKRLLVHAENLYEVAAKNSNAIRGQLSLGCFLTFAPMIVPELSFSFMSAFPDTQVNYTEGHQEQILEGLRRGSLHVALIYDLQLPPDIEFVPLVSLPIHVVVSESHPFAGRAEVTIRELVDEPLLLLDLPFSRDYFLALFQAEGVTPRIAARSAHQEMIRTMVANGYGYMLANVRPRSDQALDGRRVVRVKLAGEHKPMTLGAATLASVNKSRLVNAFLDHCRLLISETYIPGMVALREDSPAFQPSEAQAESADGTELI